MKNENIYERSFMETNAFSMSLQNSLPTGNLLTKSLGQIGPRGDNAVWMMTFHIDLLIMSLTSPGDFAQGKWVLYLQAIFCRSMSYVGQGERKCTCSMEKNNYYDFNQS